MAEVQGRPYQRGDPRSHRGGQGAVQSAALGRGQDLPEDHPQLGFPRPRRTAYAGTGLDVRDPVAAGADREVRPDDEAAPVQRRRGRREGTDEEDRRGRAQGRHQARGHERDLDALHHEGARQRALGQCFGQLHQSDQRARGADRDDQGGRPGRRYAQAVSGIPAGHAAQGISGSAREANHARIRLLVSGAGRGAVPELPRPRRVVRQQDQGARPQYQGRTAARRRLPEIDRGANCDYWVGRRGLPAGGHRVPVGDLAAR